MTAASFTMGGGFLLAFGGDPDLASWVITASYALAALACALARRRCRVRSDAGLVAGRNLERRGWTLVLLVVVALGLNKQLDLQTYLTAFGRRMAVKQDWYARRRQVQLWFMATIGVAAAVAAVVSHFATRRAGVSTALRCAVAALMWLAGFCVMRGISFHHVDAFFGLRMPGVAVKDAIEWAGVVGVAGAALACILNSDRRRLFENH